MRVLGIHSQTVTWQLEGRRAARGRTLRSARLVEVRTPHACGLGEAAPLPGLSIDTLDDDTLDDATRDLEALAARGAFDVEEVASIARIAAAARSPSARFAIETALLDALAHERGVSVAALLGSPRDVPLCAVVDDADDARAAVGRGIRCLKIKLGPDGDLERVRAIARAAPEATLRLDANRSWPPDSVRTRLAELAGLPIEYVEEPCVDAHELLADDLACPIALDESLATLSAAALAVALRGRSLAALVLKPTLLGGLSACLALAARARAAGIDAVVSHALEGPIGTAACANLALVCPSSRAVGLAPHDALAAWSLAIPQLSGTAVCPVDRPGLGLGADLRSIVATLDDPLSIAAAAQRRPDAPAIVTASGAIAFRQAGDAAARASRTRVIVATPTLCTVAAIHAALDERRPLALLHPAISDAEQARQRAAIEHATLPDDAAVVLFTSGSTAEPRGVVLSRRALLAAAEASALRLGWQDDDRWLVALSFAHAGGLAIAVRCLVARRPIVLAGDRVAEALARCTLASLVPAQLAALLDDPAWHPPPRLRAILLGGAAAAPALLAAAAARGVPFLATYGMTESFGQLATAPPARAGDPTAPLLPLAGVELVAGTRAAPAAIRVRAPMLATCYLDGAPIAPELATADLGFLEAGALHVLGRADDVIVSGGENVHPASVEAVLAATPGVRAACAFAIADARWGQIVGAAIAVGVDFDAGAVAAWHAALPAHARPRELAVVRELPRVANGKLDRRAAARLPREVVRYH